MPLPATPELRFDAYMNLLTAAIGHADRAEPLRDYCSGLLLPGERKSVEPMAARIDPDHVRRKHQSMHHFIADAPWSDDSVMHAIIDYALPVIETIEPIEAWIIDDTGLPKKGKHSVGVARQYCGRLGKQDNCQVLVTVSVAHTQASLPVAFRLYLPEAWTEDPERRSECGVPERLWFQTKPTIAMSLIESLFERDLPRAVVLADAGYGNDSLFRHQLTELGLTYAVGVRASTTVWLPGMQPHRGEKVKHPPVSVLDLARDAGETVFQDIRWREGSSAVLTSRFWAIRVVSAHHVPERGGVAREEWLLVEWPEGADEPTKFWFATLPEGSTLRQLVHVVMMRWRIERDYEELKSEIGLNHFEGRGWRGFHHHATMCIAAYAFLVAERGLFPPEEEPRWNPFRAPVLPATYRPRGAARAVGTPR
jgi:SRSO17 transposase